MRAPFEENYRADGRKLRILVAPLDWGLGHASRCIPLIYELLANHCEVILAANGAQLSLLREEFPGLETTVLPGYRVQYSRQGWKMGWKIIGQGRKILRAIRAEQEWLKTAAVALNLDAVIADNRFGLYSQSIPSLFITHQLLIKSPLGKWNERLLQRQNYAYINRFTACWVPDFPDHPSLAGELSHPGRLPTVPLHYLGPLSRFSQADQPAEIRPGQLLFLLSGPEPQRTILEEKILSEIDRFPGPAVIIRGLPGESRIIPSTNSIRIYNHLDTPRLQAELNRADLVISRSGYSTVMDLATRSKRSVLIPTPGQSEQVYLAEHLASIKFAPFIRQRDFSLANILEAAKSFSYEFPTPRQHRLREVVTDFLESLR